MNFIDKACILFSSKKIFHLLLINFLVLLHFCKIVFKYFNDSRMFKNSSSFWIENSWSIWRFLHTFSIIKVNLSLSVIFLRYSHMIIISSKLIYLIMIHWNMKLSNLLQDLFLLFKMTFLFSLFEVIFDLDVEWIDALNCFWSLLAFSYFLFSFFSFSPLSFKSFLNMLSLPFFFL